MSQRILNLETNTAAVTSFVPPPSSDEAWQPRALQREGVISRLLSFQEILSRIRRRLWWITAFVVVVLVAAFYVINGLTPVYRAATELILEQEGAAVLGLENPVGFGSLDERAIQSRLEEISSDNFLAQVAEKEGLAGVEEFNPTPLPPPGWKTWLIEKGILTPPEQLDEELLREARHTAMINRFKEKVSVRVVGVSHVVEIGVASESPELAARLANSLGQAYILTRLESRYESAERNATWFAEKVAELKADVEAADKAIEAYRADKGLIETAEGDQIGQQLAELTSQLVLAETDSATRESELRRIQSQSDNPEQLSAMVGGDNELFQSLRDQIVAKRNQIEQLGIEFGDNHPIMQAARSELGELQSAFSAELARHVAQAEDSLQAAQERESRLRQILSNLQRQAADSNQARIALASMVRDADAKRSLLESFLSRRTEITAQDDFLAEKPDARVIAAARRPLRPVFPNKPLLMGLALVASLVFACLVAVGYEELDQSYRSADQLEQRFPNLRVVATIPRFGRRQRRPNDIARAVIKKPNTPYAESIRSLAGRLATHVKSNRGHNIVLFTSAIPGEGKTSTVASVARALALLDLKTVVIDCDLRRSGLTKAFAVNPKTNGLIPYLLGHITFDQMVMRDPMTPLDVILAGGETRDVFALIGGTEFEHVVTDLRRRYDLILIDSPPIMAVDDVEVLRGLAGMILFCVHWGKTRRRTVDRALQRLIDGDGNQPLGLILSRVDVRRHASYDYGDAGVYAGSNAKYYGS